MTVCAQQDSATEGVSIPAEANRQTELIFIVPGDAVGKGRPRACRAGKGIRMYTPAKTASYEQLVQQYAVSCNGVRPLNGPLSIRLDIGVSVPASWSKKRRREALAGTERPAKKPDIDNIIKAVCDSLNGITYTDDAQIVEVSARKFYTDEPSTRVTLMQIPGEGI